ncbi:MAG: undecaprenyldiphospho-muramoylpentapeptide beta-N-acetylglucosaminyltransferase [Elusimicrobia bacterium]|nr:undecaprenyldiphospho-muramoylpentapeptide beta-N-acetylglucosaminyltransferase [Elusimicrobiota bacterium]
MKKNVLLVIGGTGGHIYPGIALAQKLTEIHRDISMNIIVDKRPLASQILREKGFLVHRITSAPLPRKKFWNIIQFILRIIKGFIQSVILLRKIKPSVIVAFGAYISVPVVLAAQLMNIPVILHEQNYFPGLANKFLTFAANRIAVSFRDSEKYFPEDKMVFTGNPIREEIFKIDRKKGLDYFGFEDERITVLIFGGSLGSESINQSILGILPYLEGFRDRIQIIHICGDKDTDRIVAEYRKEGLKARIYKYLKNMEYAYSVADVIIARAGATTVAELIALNIPSILIPYPEASSQHQIFNIKELSKIGGAIYYSESILSGEGLAIRLIPLLKDAGLRKQMASKMEALKDDSVKPVDKLAEVTGEFI